MCFQRIGWSFVVEYRFEDFLKFCHDCSITLEKDDKTYPILITDILFPSIYRTYYVIEFDILQLSDPQLTLF